MSASGPVRPRIDYLTRDFTGFRQLLLDLIDRSGTIWRERSAADLGVMLIELLANQLDHLSYAGDRVAAESFLSTARRRSSVRRHAALGDYQLDRGNATRGWQQFQLASGAAFVLPARTQLSTRLEPGQDPDRRVVFETLEDTSLDARWNAFLLAQSMPASATRLQLQALDGSMLNLHDLGVGPGLRLVLRSRDAGEVVTVARVSGDVAWLEAPLRHTWLAGDRDDATTVYGNLAPIRRGATQDWTRIGLGGASSSDLPHDVFLRRRIALLKGLREEVEWQRETWIPDPTLVQQWQIATATVAQVVQQLRLTSAAAITDELFSSLDQQLQYAAGLFRSMLLATCNQVPRTLQASPRVTLPGQTFLLPGEGRPLWMDDRPTLEVSVGVAGLWSPWQEEKAGDFLRSAPDDLHYIVDVQENGQVVLTFGDGEHGALLPAGAQVMARWIYGDPNAGDIGADALTQLISSNVGPFDPSNPTTNPVPTEGARSPEPLARVPGRLKLRLSTPVVPVTRDDYRQMTEDRADVHEAILLEPWSGYFLDATWPAARVIAQRRIRLDLVILPVVGADNTRVLEVVNSWLVEARLAGTVVRARLARPLYISLELVIEVHPEMSPSDVRRRLRDRLLELYAPGDDRVLGRARNRAEVYAAAETVPGVRWSQVTRFSQADREPTTPLEVIPAAPDQVIRCLDLSTSPLSGTIAVRIARRFSLQIELRYADPDLQPSDEEVFRLVLGQCSGVDSTPARAQWPLITAERITREALPSFANCTLRVKALLVDARQVSAIPLEPGDVPIVQFIQLIPVPGFGGSST